MAAHSIVSKGDVVSTNKYVSTCPPNTHLKPDIIITEPQGNHIDTNTTEEIVGDIEINPTTKTQGYIIDTNKREVTQGNIEINQTLNHNPSTKDSKRENIEILSSTN